MIFSINFNPLSKNMRKEILIVLSPFMALSQEIKEPVAIKKPHELKIHNHTRVDDYFWMNERDSKPVLDYVESENKYAEEYFKRLQPLQETLLQEFESRIDPNESSAPFISNGFTYQAKYIKGKDYQITYQLSKGKEKVFIDENDRADGHPYYDLATWVNSDDNSILGLTEDFVGRRNYILTFRNNKTGKFLKDRIENTDGGIVWAKDNKTVFYAKFDPQTLRTFQVYRHVLGQDQSKDELIYQEDDERYFVDVYRTNDERYIVIHCESSTTSESRIIDAAKPNEEAKIFWKRDKGHLYMVESHENGFYIRSNKNAPNNKILFTKNAGVSIDKCDEVIPHSNDILLESYLLLKNHLVTEKRENGLRKIDILNLSNGSSSPLSIDEETYFIGFAANLTYDTDDFYYSYNSMTTPSTVYKLNLTSGVKEIFHRNEVPDKSFSPDLYESKRIWATANDGTKIPISIVYKKGTVLIEAPCLLYGYGSYGYTIPDVFSATRLSLLNRGFVFACAHIRGSKYMGEEWYQNGKFLKKKNTFTDFINAAEYMGMQNYCDKNKIYINGGSAGGLLMGSVMNMAPYLFKGVVAQVPFVDVVTTMLDESIPLTVGEYEEWGNPNEEEYYYYMLNYSPYDNVHRTDYPAIYVTTGYHDSQVQYWEPLKWIAKLRDYRTNKNPLIFDCNMDAGHGGGSGRTNERIERAKVYAFILGMEGFK